MWVCVCERYEFEREESGRGTFGQSIWNYFEHEMIQIALTPRKTTNTKFNFVNFNEKSKLNRFFNAQ